MQSASMGPLNATDVIVSREYKNVTCFVMVEVCTLHFCAFLVTNNYHGTPTILQRLSIITTIT